MEQFIRNLQEQGIELWVEDGRLRFRAPQGAMTADLRAHLQDRKAEIIAWLQGRNAAIAPLPVQADYALSPAQWRLWVLMQMENSSVAYNVPLHQLIEGPLDVDRLRHALQQVAARHESLRTCFVVVDGQPRQKIVAEATIEWELVEAATETAVWQMSLEEAKRPFDLNTAPLCRAKLVRLAPQRHALLLTLHHLICDGISIGILNREITQLYGGASLPPLKLQYRDYAHWQNQWLLGEEAAQCRHYWQKQLAGELPILNLPTDFPRPILQTFNGREQTFHLSSDLLIQIKQMARREGATLFMFLLAALKILLHRYTGQTDLIVGTPAAARAHADLYDQVGFYLNSLPLRTTIDPLQSFAQFLAQVKTTVTGGLEHQQYPFDQLVNELAMRRDLSRGPLFDVMLILQNQPDAGMQLGTLQVRPFFQHSQTSKVDLTFNFNEDTAGLHLGIEYNTDLFTSERISRLGGHWGQLVAAIVAHPERPLSHLSILPDEEQRQLFEFMQTSEISETAEVLSAAIPDLWQKVVRQYGAETAVIAGETTLTFAQVDTLSSQLAHALHHHCAIEAEDRVALLLNRTEWLPVALLAVLKAGAAYVPIDPIYPRERIANILAHSQSKLLLTEETLVEQWRDGKTAVSTLSSLLPPPSPLPPHPGLHHLHLWLHRPTQRRDGDTGQSGGVYRQHDSHLEVYRRRPYVSPHPYHLRHCWAGTVVQLAHRHVCGGGRRGRYSPARKTVCPAGTPSDYRPATDPFAPETAAGWRGGDGSGTVTGVVGGGRGITASLVGAVTAVIPPHPPLQRLRPHRNHHLVNQQTPQRWSIKHRQTLAPRNHLHSRPPPQPLPHWGGGRNLHRWSRRSEGVLAAGGFDQGEVYFSG